MTGATLVGSSRRNIFFAGSAFCVVLIVGYVSDLILLRHTDWMIADDVILGIAAAIVVFFYERERSRYLSEKLRVIQEMNSYVRNELQVLYASLEQPEQTRVSTIERCVERIDWALRELLPSRQRLDVAPVEEIGDRPKEKIKRSA